MNTPFRFGIPLHFRRPWSCGNNLYFHSLAEEKLYLNFVKRDFYRQRERERGRHSHSDVHVMFSSRQQWCLITCNVTGKTWLYLKCSHHFWRSVTGDLFTMYEQRTEDSVNVSICKIVSLPHTVSVHDISSPLWNGRAVSMLMANLAAMERWNETEMLPVSHK